MKNVIVMFLVLGILGLPKAGICDDRDEHLDGFLKETYFVYEVVSYDTAKMTFSNAETKFRTKVFLRDRGKNERCLLLESPVVRVDKGKKVAAPYLVVIEYKTEKDDQESEISYLTVPSTNPFAESRFCPFDKTRIQDLAFDVTFHSFWEKAGDSSLDWRISPSIYGSSGHWEAELTDNTQSSVRTLATAKVVFHREQAKNFSSEK